MKRIRRKAFLRRFREDGMRVGGKSAWTRWVPLCGPALAIIFAGLITKGANDAALSALMATMLAGALALALALRPHEALHDAIKEHWLSALGAAGFIGWALYTASPYSAPYSHPLREAFGVGPGPASISPYRTIEGVVSFGGVAAAFALGALCVTHREDKDRIGRAISALGLAFAVYALARHALSDASADRRLMVHFGSANSAATVFSILACINAALLLRSARGRVRSAFKIGKTPEILRPFIAAPFAMASLLLCLACLLLTASRAGIAAFALAMTVFLIAALFGARREGGGGSMAAIAGIVLALALVGGGFAMERFSAFADDAHVRDIMFQTHLRAYEDRPLLGHGLNTFHELNEYYGAPEDYPALRIIGAAHNIYLQLLEEAGQIGAAFMALAVLPALARLIWMIAAARSGAEWAAGALAAAAAALAHGFVDFGLQTPAIAALLAFALGAFSRDKMSA